MADGKIQFNRKPSLEQFAIWQDNDIIGIYVNYNDHKLSFYHNNQEVWTTIFSWSDPVYVCASLVEGSKISIVNRK